MDALATTLQLLSAAKAASTKVMVEMLHPDWEEEQIDAEVALIQSETAPPALPDPMFMHPTDGSVTDGAPADNTAGESAVNS
jgi:hypothetical protein